MRVFLQVDKNVEREILNHRMLLNANVVSFKEVCMLSICWVRLQDAAAGTPTSNSN